ncbi:N-acetyltransferase eso1 [Golovinomyces cichoracearum]|uniref:DNA polymerase eta n=1 Tax=Golovinomyces cichoracearum TaxID=62708 RepID=A0A420J581_9PEZI|nr:N-acetyltransferase eso1 [Golovinomyces cichoracearum]
MSSPHSFQASSPISSAFGRRQKSRYTYRNLAQLAQSATNCPLRVIAHVDLDAFYAQCEMVRLNVPRTKPLAVQQWQGLIAINYPAREFGLNRHITVTEAKKLCPDLIVQHVPTWKEGDDQWAYRDQALLDTITHKVSLDPYRLESRRILKCIKEYLPANHQRVEKASVDEVFIDLSAQVHSILLERYPELATPAEQDDPSEFLLPPSSTVLDWKTDVLVNLSAGETELDDPDWDDISILIGSEIIRELRTRIFSQLKYTCSAGISHNKMLAKLGSAQNKPNKQTVIRSRSINQFLLGFKYAKIRGLGGKLGEQIKMTFNTDNVENLLPVSLEQLKSKLGNEPGAWVYQTIRGIDYSEVNSRTQIKSMLSAKSFRPNLNKTEQATRWLRIFAADIFSRLVEEGVLENKRRPKTINLHYRQGAQNRSRSCTISLGEKIDEIFLFDMAKNLLNQILEEGNVWPCNNLSLSVGGFEDGAVDNMKIGSFLLKGDSAKIMNVRDSNSSFVANDTNEKRRRIDSSASILSYFKRNNTINNSNNCSILSQENKNINQESEFPNSIQCSLEHQNMCLPESSPNKLLIYSDENPEFLCNRCMQRLESTIDFQSHQDWHLAKDLDTTEHTNLKSFKPSFSILNGKASINSKKRKNINGGLKIAQGQSILKFG